MTMGFLMHIVTRYVNTESGLCTQGMHMQCICYTFGGVSSLAPSYTPG